LLELFHAIFGDLRACKVTVHTLGSNEGDG
jgi:hypothetical protein